MGTSFTQKFDIVRFARERGTVSRMDISKAVGVALPTVSTLVRDLMARGAICEDGFGDSIGGRKPARLKLNPSFAGAVGAEVSSCRIAATALDLAGQAQARASQPPVPADRQAVLDALFGAVENVLQRSSGIPWRGIGVAVEGFLGNGGRTSLDLPFAEDWREVPLADMLEERFGLEAKLVNTAQAAALGEWRFGGRTERRHLLCLHLGRNVAVGLVGEGLLWQGATANAGGLGHLDAAASAQAIAGRYADALAQYAQPGIADAEPPGLAETLKAAQKGDPLALGVLQEAGRRLGEELARLTNALNPDAVVLGGALAEGPAALVEAVESRFREGLAPALSNGAAVETSRLGADACAAGAAAVVFDGLFQSPEALFGEEKAAVKEGAAS